MKKGAIVVFALLLFLISGIFAECIDSDGGRVYEIRGNVEGNTNSLFWENNIIKTDYCEVGLFGKQRYLIEFYCDKDNVKSEEVFCNLGCLDGSCILEQSEESLYSLSNNPLTLFLQFIGIIPQDSIPPFLCVPNCLNKKCGPDGCGGSCGSCSIGLTCSGGNCVSPNPCVPNCLNKKCGSNGCGGSCGGCSIGLNCIDGTCKPVDKCVPDCWNKKCGPDGCGGNCGFCSSTQTCTGGSCVDKPVCTPNCLNKKCGPDGCGGSCGSCNQGSTCLNGACLKNINFCPWYLKIFKICK